MIPQLLAIFAELLTSGALAYCPDHEGPYPSRPMSAAARLERGDVRETGTPGYYRVRSHTNSDIWHMVTVTGDEVSCECPDHLLHPPGVCVHIITAAMHYAIELVETPTINTEALVSALA